MPEDRIRLDVDPHLPVGAIAGVTIEGIPFAVVRHADGWAMFDDRCPHARCSFTHDGGEVADGVTLLCACHGSEFNLRDGSVVLGPATRGLELVPLEADEAGLSAIVT